MWEMKVPAGRTLIWGTQVVRDGSTQLHALQAGTTACNCSKLMPPLPPPLSLPPAPHTTAVATGEGARAQGRRCPSPAPPAHTSWGREGWGRTASPCPLLEHRTWQKGEGCS